jgi:uncharacterized protein (TIGR04222 family)
VDGTVWGLTGSEFLWVYTIALVALFALSLVARVAARAGGRPGDEVGVEPLDAAFLAGGRTRVGDTALAALIGSGVVHIDRSGGVHAGVGARPADPVTAAVYDSIRQHLGTRPKLIKAWRRSPAFDALETRLVARGLLHGPAARRWFALPWQLLLVLAGVGLLRLAEGVRHDRRLGLLFVAVPAAFVLARLAFGRFLVTGAGRTVLRGLVAQARGVTAQARSQARAGVAQSVPAPVVGLFAVACLGLSAHPDVDIRTALITYGHTGGGVLDNGGGGDDSSSCGGGCGGGAG